MFYKIVDGIITDDGDVFVYGGEIVYRGVFSKKVKSLCSVVLFSHYLGLMKTNILT